MNLNIPLVSIVITNYNYAQWIGEALDSVAAQSYRPLECIIVDDCSTDDSLHVIKERLQILQERNDGISYKQLFTRKNSGQLAAFQLGLKHSSGLFLCFLDADDVLFPEFISTHIQVHMMQNVAFTFCEPIDINQDGVPLTFQSTANNLYVRLGLQKKNTLPETFSSWKKKLQENEIPPETSFSPQILSDYDLNQWYWYVTSTAVLRRDTIRALEDFPGAENWRICADRLLFTYAHWRGGSCFIPLRLMAYRRHKNNGFAGAEIAGNMPLLPQKSIERSRRLERLLPEAMMDLFAADYKRLQLSGDPLGFLHLIVYFTGPAFLWKHRQKCSRWFQRAPGFWIGELWIKTIFRHFQYRIRGKRKHNA